MSHLFDFHSTVDKIEWASRRLLNYLKMENWREETLFEVRLAVEEALANAIQHGNQQDPSKKVRFQFSLNRQRDELTITIEDQGRGFQHSSTPSTGGYGLVLIHRLMDEVRYNQIGNQIHMVKRVKNIR